MIHYDFIIENPNTQFFAIEITAEGLTPGSIALKIPAWRPGRYELGFFFKNIRSVKGKNASASLVPLEKTAKDTWMAQVNAEGRLWVRYELYAPLLNAGSTYLDEEKFQVNPVNACLMVTGYENALHTITFHIPEAHRWTVATGMEKQGKNPLTYQVPSFDRLADSPVLGGIKVSHFIMDVDGLPVHYWFFGPHKLPAGADTGTELLNRDLSGSFGHKLWDDFYAFITEQVHAFGNFPEKEFHFFFQSTPQRSHHGVEHENTTICMLGPAYQLWNELYEEFMGLASHEFYHAWNIKKIRPAEMLPYDLTRENYSRLGFVAEGVTTYYGDIMLLRSHVYTVQQYMGCLEELFEKHFHHYGRWNQSVAEASFDTWVDGYEPGIPHRKTSIYTEGALLALAADLDIIYSSGGRYSLDNVMQTLYTQFACNGKGYTMEDYRALLGQFSGHSYETYFQDFVMGTKDYEPLLAAALEKAGLWIHQTANPQVAESVFGMKVLEESSRIWAVAPGSPAENAGLMLNDTILSIEGYNVEKHANAWMNFWGGTPLHLQVKSGERIREIVLLPGEKVFYPHYRVDFLPEITTEAAKIFSRWTKQ